MSSDYPSRTRIVRQGVASSKTNLTATRIINRAHEALMLHTGQKMLQLIAYKHYSSLIEKSGVTGR
mgnify:FL=1